MSLKRGVATFTLDYGKCPAWLFERMVKLGKEIVYVLIEEYGPDEFIKRISDPVWFQSLGTVLAFDWNSSGLTTILTAALKEAIRGEEKEIGIFICGGKGKTSRKTPQEIKDWEEKLSLSKEKVDTLIYNSRMAAKVDNSLIQDGFQIYHHSFFFSQNWVWAVVQQGMNTIEQTARRYHWFSEKITDLVCEPHTGISSETFQVNVLNLVSKESEETRKISTELVQTSFKSIMKDIEILRRHSSPLSQMVSLKSGENQLTLLKLEDTEFRYHPITLSSKYLEKILAYLTFKKPKTYEQLLATEGVGPKTIRALALVAEVIYGAKPSYQDPARYSFAHGGKDATPYPVDTKTYDQTIAILKKAINKAKIDLTDKKRALSSMVFRATPLKSPPCQII